MKKVIFGLGDQNVRDVRLSRLNSIEEGILPSEVAPLRSKGYCRIKGSQPYFVHLWLKMTCR